MAGKAVDQYTTDVPNASLNASTETGLTCIGLMRVFRKHIIAFIITFCVTIIAVCAWTATRPVEYATTTQLFATYNNSSDTSSNSAEQYSGSSYIMSQIKSYPTLTTTQSVLQPVIDDLELRETVSGLASEISVANPENTAFINITVSNEDPKMAASIANAVAASLSKVVQNSLYTSGSNSAVKLVIVQPAQIPVSPSSPKWVLNIVLGIIAGLVLGALLALLKDMLSKTIQTEDEVRDYIDAPIIGRVSEDPLLAKSIPVVVEEPGSPTAEDFRRIRTNLSFIVPVSKTNCRLIVITSTGASEGKTTTSVNIAAALAENGSRVLLIDADLRHPSVAKKMDIDGSAGLTHVLSGQASVKDVIQRYWKPNLHILPAGPKPPNASALLNSATMFELMGNAMHQYDYVLIDTAPMIVANDAATFLRQGGSLVMVCRRDQTQKHDLQEIAAELQALDLNTSGILFNYAKENKKVLENSNYYYYSNNDTHKGNKKNRRDKK